MVLQPPGEFKAGQTLPMRKPHGSAALFQELVFNELIEMTCTRPSKVFVAIDCKPIFELLKIAFESTVAGG